MEKFREKEILFRLHMYIDEKLVDLVEEYSLSDLGDIPKIGDHIVNPWVSSGLDRREPQNRTIYKVENRYFFPTANEESENNDWKYIVLVVTESSMCETESVLLMGSP